MNQFTAVQPLPIAQPTGGEIFDMADADRVAYLKSLGAKNVDPPLPRSTHLKIIASGRVLPWEEMLSEQHDLVECCDEHGNTDPNAWMPTVDSDEYDPNEKQVMLLRSQAIVLGQATQMINTHRVVEAVNTTPRPTEYPHGAIPLSDIDKLKKMLE